MPTEMEQPGGPEDLEANSPNNGRDNQDNARTQQPTDRPYGDAGNLYEIPRVRSDDPPMRNWWIDDDNQLQRDDD